MKLVSPKLVNLGAGLPLAGTSAVQERGARGSPLSFRKSIAFLCQDSPAFPGFSWEHLQTVKGTESQTQQHQRREESRCAGAVQNPLFVSLLPYSAYIGEQLYLVWTQVTFISQERLEHTPFQESNLMETLF